MKNAVKKTKTTDSFLSVRCAECGRAQQRDEGFWMLCDSCGTFRCPSCYGNPLEKTDCPLCRDREEARRIVDFLFETKRLLTKRKAS